jgi:hypothetical protein
MFRTIFADMKSSGGSVAKTFDLSATTMLKSYPTIGKEKCHMRPNLFKWKHYQRATRLLDNIITQNYFIFLPIQPPPQTRIE